MANTYSQIYLQIVTVVKYRAAVIDDSWCDQLYANMGNLINKKGCKPIIINGVGDHVHLFIGLKPTVSVSELMQSVKGVTSKWINDNQLTASRFEWQEGYGVFSYSHSHFNRVYRYVANQKKHHKKRTFRDEYLEFLNKFEVLYDEQYIFEEIAR